jgi:hypothetical protein
MPDAQVIGTCWQDKTRTAVVGIHRLDHKKTRADSDPSGSTELSTLRTVYYQQGAMNHSTIELYPDELALAGHGGVR